MSQCFFITGTGTGVGKSFITTVLCQQLLANEGNVAAIKPIISGYQEGDMASDTALILQSLGIAVSKQNIEKISPWRFSAPLSPDMAARLEGRKIAPDEVVDFCKLRAKSVDTLIIEGVGGVYVPFNEAYTQLDLMAELVEKLDAKIILVVGSYLGSISHTLTAIAALAVKNLRLHTLIINESENSAVPLAEIVKSLVNFVPKDLSIICIPRYNDGAKFLDISSICI
jgi:dethiobiotin synthetase